MIQLEQLTAALKDRYAIERQLGSGGMATVYLAEDLKHRRKVAVKVLRPELAAILGAERFLHEIEVTANLQHPNILPLYDSGEADSFLFYVMPFIEGESLREKLNREKQLAIDESVSIAQDVAAALHFAHGRGVVHRDIKPENILLQDGRPVVADFGIALAVTQAGGSRITETGLSLGTPQYMSPEQATGERELDARSDVYSLGATLYEMLTGDPPHVGSSVQAIIASVMTEEPRPITAWRVTVPPNVAAAVHVALNKLPVDRFVSAAEFAEALGDPTFVDPRSAHAATQTAVEHWKRVAVGFAAVAALLLVAAGFFVFRGPGSTSGLEGPVHLSIPLSPGHEIVGAPAISRDGQTVAYTAGPRGSVGRLYIRRLQEDRATEVRDSEGAKAPFFSWNGDQVGFYAREGLWRVFVQGGDPIRITDAVAYFGGAWGPDDHIIYVSSLASGLMRVPAIGGTPERLTEPNFADRGYAHTWPVIVGDGRAVLHNVWGSAGGVARLDLRTMEWEKSQLGLFSTYAESGFLLGRTWVSGASTIRAGRFDPEGSIPPSLDYPVLVGSYYTQLDAWEWLALSTNGTLVYAPGDPARRRLALMSPQGEKTHFSLDLAQYEQIAVAPGGRRAAVLIASNRMAMLDIERGVLETFLTPRSNLDVIFHPVWSPDGSILYYASNRTDDWDIYRLNPDGAGVGEAVMTRPGFELPLSVGPDGSLVLLSEERGDRDLHILAPRDTAPVLFHRADGDQVQARFSPLGNAIAFVSETPGRYEVYIKSYPGPAERRAVRVGLGKAPIWAPNGRELFFVTGDSLLGVDVNVTNSRVGVGTPRLVLRGNFWSDIWGQPFDVLPDGRFLIVDPMPDSYPTRLDLIFNFFDVIEERVGRD